MFAQLCVFVLCVVVIFYFYATRKFDYWKKRGIPYEKPIPVFGNLWDSVIFRKGAGEISTDIYRKHPNEKVVGMFHFDSPVLLIRDPEIVYRIFVTDFHYFADNGMTIDKDVDPVFSRNMFFQKGEEWKRTRQMMSPAFTVGKIKPMFDEIVSVGNKLRQHVEEHPEEFELKLLMTRYTTEVVAACGLGIDGHSFGENKPMLIRIGQMIFEPGLKKGIVQLIVLLIPTLSKLFRVKMVPKEVPEFFDGLLRDVIRHRQLNSLDDRQDLIRYWIELKRKSQEAAKGNIKSDFLIRELDDNDILNGCLTFFVEGYETTSTVASFALHYLALNKDVQDRVKEDIDELYAKHDGKLTFEGIGDMTLLNNIILEVLRLHPVLIHALKSCTRNYGMDVGKSETLVVEKGTIVVIPNAALSTDPHYWTNPEKFDPERFNYMNKDDWKKGVFFPFGEGPRICIGVRLAYLIVKVCLIRVLKDFEVVPTARTPSKIVQDPRHFISRSRTGLYGRFVKRA